MRFTREIAVLSASLTLAACSPKPVESAQAPEPPIPILTMSYTAELPSDAIVCPPRTYPNTSFGDAQRREAPPKWDCPSGTTVTDDMIDSSQGRVSTPKFSDTA